MKQSEVSMENRWELQDQPAVQRSFGMVYRWLCEVLYKNIGSATAFTCLTFVKSSKEKSL